jgi:hypothetical protein
MALIDKKEGGRAGHRAGHTSILSLILPYYNIRKVYLSLSL